MSAAMVVLPMVWAAIEAAAQENSAKGPVSIAGTALRKGPHSLRLVQAAAKTTSSASLLSSDAVLPMADEAIRLRPSPKLAFYRKYTEAMLRRYVRLSMEAGRAPSLLGRELFQGNVSHYKVKSFDDVVMGDLKVLKSQMEQVMGIGQPGRLHHLEQRISRNERGVQRMRGIGAAFGTGLTMLHIAISYFTEKHH